MATLTERMRPKTFTDVVGQDEALDRIGFVSKTSGLQGQVFLLTGLSGTGKTTIARLIANKVACGEHTCITEIDAIDVTLDLLRQWERDCQYTPLFGSAYCYVINEVHNLGTKSISRLQTTLEDPNVCKNSTWVFTTTSQGQQRMFDTKFDALPFLSRAHHIELSKNEKTISAFAQRAHDIALECGCGEKPIEFYVDLVFKCGGNLRKVIKEIESGHTLLEAT